MAYRPPRPTGQAALARTALIARRLADTEERLAEVQRHLVADLGPMPLDMAVRARTNAAKLRRYADGLDRRLRS